MRKEHIIPLMVLLAISGCQTAKNDGVLSSNSAITEGADVEVASGAENAQDLSYETTASIGSASGDVASANSIQKYVPPQPGTVFTWRNNWANLPEFISYKVAGTQKIGGKEYVKFTSVKGLKAATHAYYSTEDFSLKGYRDRKNRALVTYKPVEQRYRFPMAPGDKWLSRWKSLDHKTQKVTSGGGVVSVIRMETLDLPAGSFRALKVKMPVQKNAPRGLTHYAWFSPELGITIKEEIGGGILNWTQVLEKVEYPG